MNDDQPVANRASSVGVVRTQFARFAQPLPLDDGGTLPAFTLAYETYGALNAERSNAILICHALSGDAHVAGYHTDDPDERPGWWEAAVGPGRMFDADLFFIICSNVLGGCRGSTGPASLAPDGRPFGPRFPRLTIADMVRAQQWLLDHLGIVRLFAVAGGSMGAMQALQWAVAASERVGVVLFLAGTARSSAQNIALNEIGRQAITADPCWHGGDYYAGEPPRAGLAVARMVGHISYMSEVSLERKFGRGRQPGTSDFAVASYLKYQGEKFVQRFDANSYMVITRALDAFDLTAGHASLAEALRPIQGPTLVVSYSSDWLYPPAHAQTLVRALRQAGKDVAHQHLLADYGHDSFLVETETLTAVVGGYLSRFWRRHAAGGPWKPLTQGRAPAWGAALL